MKQIKFFITLCILPMVLGSCSVIKQTITPVKAEKSVATLPTNNSVQSSMIDGYNFKDYRFPVKVALNNIKPVNISSFIVNHSISPLSIATNSINSLLTISGVTLHNAMLFAFIESWYGTPYRFGGTSRRGIDCSAFVQELYEHVYGLELLRTAAAQFGSTIRIKSQSELKEGDLVFFKIHSRRISHVGVYLSDGNFVHASLSNGVTISNLNDTYWTRYYAAAGRVNS